MRERCERCDVKQSTVVTARWQLCPSWECESCVAIPDPVREQTRELAEARTALAAANERADSLRTRLAAVEAERDEQTEHADTLKRSDRQSLADYRKLRAQLDAAVERAEQAEAERDRYRSALRDVAREWPYLDLIDPHTAQECDLRGLVEYLLGALRSEQRVAREVLEGLNDA